MGTPSHKVPFDIEVKIVMIKLVEVISWFSVTSR